MNRQRQTQKSNTNQHNEPTQKTDTNKPTKQTDHTTVPLRRLSASEFRRFVLEAPRPYWLLVSLTTLELPPGPSSSSPKSQPCLLCFMAHNATAEFSAGLHRLNEQLFANREPGVAGAEAFVR